MSFRLEPKFIAAPKETPQAEEQGKFLGQIAVIEETLKQAVWSHFQG